MSRQRWDAFVHSLISPKRHCSPQDRSVKNALTTEFDLNGDEVDDARINELQYPHCNRSVVSVDSTPRQSGRSSCDAKHAAAIAEMRPAPVSAKPLFESTTMHLKLPYYTPPSFSDMCINTYSLQAIHQWSSDLYEWASETLAVRTSTFNEAPSESHSYVQTQRTSSLLKQCIRVNLLEPLDHSMDQTPASPALTSSSSSSSSSPSSLAPRCHARIARRPKCLVLQADHAGLGASSIVQRIHAHICRLVTPCTPYLAMGPLDVIDFSYLVETARIHTSRALIEPVLAALPPLYDNTNNGVTLSALRILGVLMMRTAILETSHRSTSLQWLVWEGTDTLFTYLEDADFRDHSKPSELCQLAANTLFRAIRHNLQVHTLIISQTTAGVHYWTRQLRRMLKSQCDLVQCRLYDPSVTEFRNWVALARTLPNSPAMLRIYDGCSSNVAADHVLQRWISLDNNFASLASQAAFQYGDKTHATATRGAAVGSDQPRTNVSDQDWHVVLRDGKLTQEPLPKPRANTECPTVEAGRSLISLDVFAACQRLMTSPTVVQLSPQSLVSWGEMDTTTMLDWYSRTIPTLSTSVLNALDGAGDGLGHYAHFASMLAEADVARTRHSHVAVSQVNEGYAMLALGTILTSTTIPLPCRSLKGQYPKTLPPAITYSLNDPHRERRLMLQRAMSAFRKAVGEHSADAADFQEVSESNARDLVKSLIQHWENRASEPKLFALLASIARPSVCEKFPHDDADVAGESCPELKPRSILGAFIESLTRVLERNVAFLADRLSMRILLASVRHPDQASWRHNNTEHRSNVMPYEPLEDARWPTILQHAPSAEFLTLNELTGDERSRQPSVRLMNLGVGQTLQEEFAIGDLRGTAECLFGLHTHWTTLWHYHATESERSTPLSEETTCCGGPTKCFLFLWGCNSLADDDVLVIDDTGDGNEHHPTLVYSTHIAPVSPQLLPQLTRHELVRLVRCMFAITSVRQHHTKRSLTSRSSSSCRRTVIVLDTHNEQHSMRYECEDEGEKISLMDADELDDQDWSYHAQGSYPLVRRTQLCIPVERGPLQHHWIMLDACLWRTVSLTRHAEQIHLRVHLSTHDPNRNENESIPT